LALPVAWRRLKLFAALAVKGAKSHHPTAPFSSLALSIALEPKKQGAPAEELEPGYLTGAVVMPMPEAPQRVEFIGDGDGDLKEVGVHTQ
jgi:hypothetical protein